MASYLKRMADDRILVGRRSGDEFYMFFYHCASIQEAEESMWEFYQMVEEEPVYYPDDRVEPMGISSGLAYVEEGTSLDFVELLAEADKKLYVAKEKGRGKLESGLADSAI